MRLSEALSIKFSQIERDNNRVKIHGKGAKERYVPLPAPMLDELGQWWKYHRHPRLLFPALGRNWKQNQRKHRADEEMARICALLDWPLSSPSEVGCAAETGQAGLECPECGGRLCFLQAWGRGRSPPWITQAMDR